MACTLSDRVQANPSILMTEIGNAIVLLDVDSGRYYNFEAVAGEIWRRIATPCSVRDLCEGLAQEYDAPVERIQTTTLAFLTTLTKKRLAHIVPAGSQTGP